MLNECCFEGRMTRDPKVSGKGLYFTLAVQRPYKDKETGERGADFLPMALYHTVDRQAEILKKGDMVSIRAVAKSYIKDGRDRIIFEIKELHYIDVKYFRKTDDTSGMIPAPGEDIPEEFEMPEPQISEEPEQEEFMPDDEEE